VECKPPATPPTTNGYDSLLRRGNLSVLNAASGLLTSTAYGNDSASRLLTVTSGNNTATYSYLANSPWVGQIAFANNGTVTMTTTKQYDYLNRLTGIQSGTGVAPVSSFSYAYNSANQRTLVTNINNSHWVYQYDRLGQEISGKKCWSDGTPVAGQQFTYSFDSIGNRKGRAAGGDACGNNLRSANYTANNLYQYTSRDVPGYATVLGSANPNATMTVNLQRAVRQGSYFWDELPENNSASSPYISLTNLAVLNSGTNADIVATDVGDALLPQTPETFGYDADGNMTNSGRWTITWDAENRAISFASPASGPTASQRKVDCTSDFMGRRIQKIVSTNNGSAWVSVSTNKFVYDGWNLVAILSSPSSIAQSFTWGTDLSGSEQGAGGVGGLLSLTVYFGQNAGSYDYVYDGNGNLAVLVNAANGGMVGRWEYGPFGEVVRSSGTMAKANSFRLSTKFQDDETGLLYFGYRFYDSCAGAWANRDRCEETGGLNSFKEEHEINAFNFPIKGTFQIYP
jgi:RHS repeat-associated protein